MEQRTSAVLVDNFFKESENLWQRMQMLEMVNQPSP